MLSLRNGRKHPKMAKPGEANPPLAGWSGQVPIAIILFTDSESLFFPFDDWRPTHRPLRGAYRQLSEFRSGGGSRFLPSGPPPRRNTIPSKPPCNAGRGGHLSFSPPGTFFLPDQPARRNIAKRVDKAYPGKPQGGRPSTCSDCSDLFRGAFVYLLRRYAFRPERLRKMAAGVTWGNFPRNRIGRKKEGSQP